MSSKIQQLGRGQRVVIFVSIFFGGLMFLVALTFLLITFSVNSSPRELALPASEGVTVREFATLPDDDAYPSSLTVDANGTVYVGSYRTGAIWAIAPNGTVRELPETRILIASVIGLDVAPDGTLFALDRTNPNPAAAGGIVWRIPPNGTPQNFGTIFDGQDGFLAPNDLAVADDGVVYVVDRGRREVWRFSPDGGEGEFWWRVPLSDPQANVVLPTGIAYDPTTDTMVITASGDGVDNLYRVSRDAQETDTMYRYSGAKVTAPGFDGISISPEGRIFLANFSQRGVSEFIRTDYKMLAQGFRGSNDVVYFEGKLYVNNFDQVGLVNPLVQPRLPFAIDEVTLP